MISTAPKYKPLFILALFGLCVAILSTLESHLPLLASFCGFFGEGCKETASFTLFHIPVSYWGIAYFVVLAFGIFLAKPWVFWAAMSGIGVELTFLWLMISMDMVCFFCIANLLVFTFLFFFAFDKNRIWQTVSMALIFFIFSNLLIAWENNTEPKAKLERSGDTVVASVAGTDITVEELESPLANRIYRMQEEIYGLKRRRLDNLITKILLEKTAQQQGISLQSLLNLIYSNGIDVTEHEVTRYYQQNRNRLAGMKDTEESIRKQIKAYLEERKRNLKIKAYVKPLKEKYEVTVFLAPPSLPFTSVSDGNSPVWGSLDAPVTIIEFSNYLCPACQAVHDTTKKIRERYQGKIKWVFKNFPLKRHKGAKKLAEAARCAGEQEKFWEYQDLLFATNGKPDSDQLKAYAEKLGLEINRFDQCLESGKYLSEIEKDIASATKAGVDATPTFIINGRMRSGAPSLEKFQEMVDEALNKAKE